MSPFRLRVIARPAFRGTKQSANGGSTYNLQLITHNSFPSLISHISPLHKSTAHFLWLIKLIITLTIMSLSSDLDSAIINVSATKALSSITLFP